MNCKRSLFLLLIDLLAHSAAKGRRRSSIRLVVFA